MRRRLLLSAALVLLPALAPATAEATRPARAPATGGGLEYAPPEPLKATTFQVAPATIQPGGAPVRFTYRVDGGARRVRVRIDIARVPDGKVAQRVRCGARRSGRRYTRTWALPDGALEHGPYVARFTAADAATTPGAEHARSASARSRLQVVATPVTVGAGVFPVRGPWSFGTEANRFAAPRTGHQHRGQDILAALGTPIAAPRAGTVTWRAYQGSGAGHYLVIHGDDGRDYVFMHLSEASPYGPGTRVAAGEIIGAIGMTGATTGPHLHFEIWPNGWFTDDASTPIDPLPDLQSWAAAGTT